MAINFWEAQRHARTTTAIYVLIFSVLAILVASIGEVALRVLAPDSYGGPVPYMGMAILGLTVGVALMEYAAYSMEGGGYVARAVGGRLVPKTTQNPKLQQLLNVVEEISVASRVPMPEVYLLPAQEINAFAAGLKTDQAAVAITWGALEQLNREEIQGVIAHEFGHIRNRDMRLTMRLAAMLAGFFFMVTIGFRLLQYTTWFPETEGRREDDKRGGNPLVIAALIFLVAGVVSWFFGSMLRSLVSQQREYLADASSVQFTRSTRGLVGALRKIGRSQVQDMPQAGSAYAHLYLSNKSFWGSLFDSHPPLEKRIAALEGGTYKAEEEQIEAETPPPK